MISCLILSLYTVMIEHLIQKTKSWEDEHATHFLYDGVGYHINAFVDFPMHAYLDSSLMINFNGHIFSGSLTRCARRAQSAEKRERAREEKGKGMGSVFVIE